MTSFLSAVPQGGEAQKEVLLSAPSTRWQKFIRGKFLSSTWFLLCEALHTMSSGHSLFHLGDLCVRYQGT